MYETLLATIKKWIYPPVLSTEEDFQRRVNILHLIIGFGLVASILSFFGNLAGGIAPRQVLMSNLILAGVYVVLFLLLRFGYVEICGWGANILLVVMLTYSIAMQGGIRTPAVSWYLLFIIVSGSLYGRQGILYSTATASLAVLGLIMAQNGGMLPPAEPRVGISQWVILTLAFSLVGMFTFSGNWYLARDMKKMMAENEERKRVNLELRITGSRNKALLQAIPDLMLRTDPAGKIFDCNLPNGNNLFNPERHLGHKLAQVFEPAIAHLLVGALDEARHGAGLATVEFGTEEGGHPSFYETRVAYNQENNEFFLIFRDISQRRKDELQIANYRDHLEDLVAERTAQMEQARDFAEGANRAKSDFLAVMSHEIRTPMNGVIGLANLLMLTELTDKQHHYLVQLRASGEALLTVLNDILDFSKIEAGKFNLEKIDFCLDDVLHSLAEIVSYRASEKGLELVFNCPPSVPRYLQGDPIRLRQVLLNLVGNALKFTEAGDVVLRVEALQQTGSATRIRFEIRDTGVGMSDDQIGRLFQPFTQSDNSTARKYGGTGLGLTISKRIVELMGGKIWAESKVGLGSSFIFDIEFPVQAEGAHVEQALPANLRGMQVLLVEDNPDAAAFTDSVLRSLTFNVDLAADGGAAIEAMRAKAKQNARYEMLLLDMTLPGEMNVASLVARMKADPQIHIPPTLILAPSEEAASDHLLPACWVMVKPITASNIFDGVMNLFARDKGAVAERRRRPVHLEEKNAFKQRRVLLVEDNPINQVVAGELLEKMGLTVDIAGGGFTGLQKVQQSDYDLILMDIQMPGLDGYETTRRIRQLSQKKLREMPIIAMTAHALIGDREKALAAGLDDYVTKPIDVAELGNTLTRWLPAAPTAALPVTGTLGTAPSAGVADVYDKAAAMARLNNKAELYNKLLVLYREETASFFGRFDEAQTNGDSDTMTRLAHNLKSTSGTVGAVGVQKAAAALEAKLMSQTKPAGAKTEMAAVKAAYQALMAVLG